MTSTEAFAYSEVPPGPRAPKALDDLLLQREVEEFFYHEADLLDQWRYREWLELITDDIRYWMPLRRNVEFGDWARERTRELEDLAWFDENKTTLEKRVRQLMSGLHWAAEPLSRITHMITNVRITGHTAGAGKPEEVRARCRFLVYRNHLEDEETLLIGKREDVLRRENGELRLARRSIFLDQNVLLAKNLTFLC